jgi:hypothetical protein
MGMFDSFLHRCPKCGEDIDWQSKAGPCKLENYRLDTNPPPPKVAGDLDGQCATCSKCGHTMKIACQYMIMVVDAAN